MFQLMKLALTLVFVFAFVSSANATIYDCKIGNTGAGDKSGIPPHIIVTEKDGEATVIDDRIQHNVGKPIKAEISTDNAKRITFVWRVDMVEGRTKAGSRAQAKLIYRLTYQKASGKVSVFMKPLGFGNTFRAQGTCTLK